MTRLSRKLNIRILGDSVVVDLGGSQKIVFFSTSGSMESMSIFFEGFSEPFGDVFLIFMSKNVIEDFHIRFLRYDMIGR